MIWWLKALAPQWVIGLVEAYRARRRKAREDFWAGVRYEATEVAKTVVDEAAVLERARLEEIARIAAAEVATEKVAETRAALDKALTVLKELTDERDASRQEIDELLKDLE